MPFIITPSPRRRFENKASIERNKTRAKAHHAALKRGRESEASSPLVQIEPEPEPKGLHEF
jgi:hypothetical protein